MRLDFNILWVEDQQKSVISQLNRIELLIRKEGFRLQAKFATTVDEAMSFLSQDIYGDHIDMILMDYDLGAGKHGDDGLIEVRNKFSYKDIIFYSSKAQDLRKMVADRQIQGVYCSTREDLPDTVVGAFETLVKKVLDIDHSRGIIMGATSDIDHCVNDSLVTLFDSSNLECQESTLKVLLKHLKERKKDFDKETAQIADLKHVSDLFDKHYVYTSNDRLRLLKNALKINGYNIEKIELVKKYINETVPKRNLLAHVRVEVNGFSRKLYHKGKEFTSEEMKSLRLELLNSQERFETLLAELRK